MRLLLVVALLSCVLADYPPVAVTSTSTEAQNGGGLSECDDFTDEASCVAFGSRDTPVGDYGACVWCGRSATDGQSIEIPIDSVFPPLSTFASRLLALRSLSRALLVGQLFVSCCQCIVVELQLFAGRHNCRMRILLQQCLRD